MNTTRKIKILKRIIYPVFICILIIISYFVALKPVILNYYITNAAKFTRGQFVCSIDEKGNHISKLYKINNQKKELKKIHSGDKCTFSRPSVNTGFFVLVIGGGGGATPFESGNHGEIISKYLRITNPEITISIGQGGKGTYIKQNVLYDAQNGQNTKIEQLGIIAKGGTKSTRMTPLGIKENAQEYHISEKYHQLYNIPKSARYGAGGSAPVTSQYDLKILNGNSGVVIIQW